jgi:uncharacterized protein YoxC
MSHQIAPMQRSTGVFIGATVLGILIALAIGFVTVHIINQLDSMSANLTRVSSSLETLKSMNQKLDMLSGMSLTLHQMDEKLSITNGALAVANTKLSSMAQESLKAGSSLNSMSRTLAGMQGDIRIMSKKISGSFLFRSVKTH